MSSHEAGSLSLSVECTFAQLLIFQDCSTDVGKDGHNYWWWQAWMGGDSMTLCEQATLIDQS